jgi:hypothetical protein
MAPPFSTAVNISKDQDRRGVPLVWGILLGMLLKVTAVSLKKNVTFLWCLSRERNGYLVVASWQQSQRQRGDPPISAVAVDSGHLLGWPIVNPNIHRPTAGPNQVIDGDLSSLHTLLDGNPDLKTQRRPCRVGPPEHRHSIFKSFRQRVIRWPNPLPASIDHCSSDRHESGLLPVVST